MFLGVVDSYTKGMEVLYTTSSKSAGVIQKLRAIFATSRSLWNVMLDNWESQFDLCRLINK